MVRRRNLVAAVSSRLKQDIQHLSFVIDGSPEKELLAADLQKHLVDVPG
jgi:hypothetical protein